MTLVEGQAGNKAHECYLKKAYDSHNCDVYSVSSPLRNQECRANISFYPNIPLYMKIGVIFGYMEIAITTKISVKPSRIKIEKYMFVNEHDWHHIELQEKEGLNGYNYSVYINDTFKKRITSSNKATNIEVYIKGYPNYALGCNPGPIQTTPQPTSQTTSDHWTTPSPSLPTPTNGDIDTDSKEYQPDQEGYSPLFIISVSAGVAGVVLLIIIVILCYVLCKRLKSDKEDKAQSPLGNETEIISFHNNQQHLSPQDDPMEDDPEKHIYWEVTDLGPVASVGAMCNDKRGSTHESVNSLYASFDYYMEEDK
ncbi:hypothetical protein Pmani_015024 [Petrolisthes manimaculis]|uniref:Uncharacterized protein n=1 Tax=Petrolisthes manimaculis TaxID=1843537 RepID=A0AAE1PRM5_9EUCA|nr:hypothetical protein Pmani_015024 [Petrolisthes manimaculis]